MCVWFFVGLVGKLLKRRFYYSREVLGCPPSQDSSHHQDYYFFRIGNPNLNLHLPQLLGGGTTQDRCNTYARCSVSSDCYPLRFSVALHEALGHRHRSLCITIFLQCCHQRSRQFLASLRSLVSIPTCHVLPTQRK